MEKVHRPPGIITDSAAIGEGGTLKRTSSLLPGEIRTPAFAIVSLSDWAAPGSSLMDEDSPVNAQTSSQTPLTGYGHRWESTTASPLLGEGDVVPFDQRCDYGREGIVEAAVAAAALQALAPEELTATHLLEEDGANSIAPPDVCNAGSLHNPTPTSIRNGPYSYTAYYSGQSRNDNSTGTETSRSPRKAARPRYFTVKEGNDGHTPSATAPAPSVARQHLPSLENRVVARNIIVSAGLPLSMTSLADYIKEGQPHVPIRTYTAAQTHRNYPDPSEPPAADGSDAVWGAGGGYTSHLTGGPQHQGHSRGGGSGPFTTASIKVYREQRPAAGGKERGWNVQGQNRPNYTAVSQVPNNKSNGFIVRSGGSLYDLDHSKEQHLPPDAFTVNPASQSHRQHATSQSELRHKSENEVLSNLLHFHANFFPPPPPPRVPTLERRRRAELWYHYASKWDITHRLPPPPRTPLPEMEMEYHLRLQEMTRVPYRGDGWLQMSERWFDVMQSLFDYPADSCGLEVDIGVIMEHAVMA